MLPFDDNIIKVISDAYQAGFNIPKKYFEHERDKIQAGEEVFHNDPLYIIKPEGIEFTYILFWNGERFKGGYISINNNYSGVQRGVYSRNGETLFADHIVELKRAYKKLVRADEPKWLCLAFVLSNEGKIYYWGLDFIHRYEDQISKLAGVDFGELEQMFMSGEKTRKPEGFVSSLLIKINDTHVGVHVGGVFKSISKSWNNLYENAEKYSRDNEFTYNVDSYVRKAYSMMKIHKKIP